MKIGIIGCGWLGIKIADYFKPENEIFVTTTTPAKSEKFISEGLQTTVMHFLDDTIVEDTTTWEQLKNLDVLIITVPFSKRASIELLKNRFTNLCLFIKTFEKQMFLMSSIGIYPQMDTDISETTLADDLLNPSISSVENWMRQRYPHINILRLGGLMGGNRILSNYQVSTPNQIVNHVHYDDINHIIKKMIDLKMNKKTYNVVAPLHPTKQEIIHFQQENNESVVIEKPFGRKVLSDKLQAELNYHFIRPNPITFHRSSTAIKSS